MHIASDVSNDMRESTTTHTTVPNNDRLWQPTGNGAGHTKDKLRRVRTSMDVVPAFTKMRLRRQVALKGSGSSRNMIMRLMRSSVRPSRKLPAGRHWECIARVNMATGIGCGTKTTCSCEPCLPVCPRQMSITR